MGHRVAAGPRGLALAPPLLIPAGLGLLGSFGAITRIRSDVPDRQSLLEVAVAGPAAGAVASLALLLVGLGLTAAGLGGIELDANSFRRVTAVQGGGDEQSKQGGAGGLGLPWVLLTPTSYASSAPQGFAACWRPGPALPGRSPL